LFYIKLGIAEQKSAFPTSYQPFKCNYRQIILFGKHSKVHKCWYSCISYWNFLSYSKAAFSTTNTEPTL